MGLFSRTKKQVKPTEAQTMAAEGAVLVDVRTNEEWRAGRAPRAKHIPLESITRRQSELSKDATLITVCRSGRRSATAAKQLRQDGFTVLNLHGGMQAWAAAGLPVVRSGGKAGQIT